MKNAILSTLNYRIIIILVETVSIFILYKTFQFNVDVDFFIFSIAIVFPLVFSITSAYQRRQESIIEFTKFRNKIIDITNLMYAVNGFKKENYNMIFTNLLGIQNQFLNYLIKDSGSIYRFSIFKINSKKSAKFLVLLFYLPYRIPNKTPCLVQCCTQ